MIRVSVLYPAGAGHTVDMPHDLGTHLPKVRMVLDTQPIVQVNEGTLS